MAGQPEVDPVPDTGEFGVVIDLLGVHRDAGQEGESVAEILEAEAPLQGLAVCAQRSSRRECPWRPPYALQSRRWQAQMGAQKE